ncbi:MAG: hypothetical protein KJ063_13535 [Anaerolineae bacterium]|nr:hypothetical protein [Anaerolineae bacterium]
MIVLSILIAASMILGLVVGLGGGFGGSSSSLIDPFLVQAQLWVTLF